MEAIGQLLKAIEFASKKHQKQRRKGDKDIPYINHPIEVANYLFKEGKQSDITLLIGAVLHDTVEDTHTTFSEIQINFGSEVEALVKEVTDDKSLTKKERKVLQIKNASKKSDKAKMLKIADKTCNVRDIINMPPNWTTQRKLEYLKWAKAVVDEMRGVHSGMEAKFDEWYHFGLTMLSE